MVKMLNSSEEPALGQKIRNFRIKAGLSQFELENQIGASPGSLSRIENGQVNPTKETLQKVIEVLDLRISEAATLFNLNLQQFPKIIRLAKNISSSLNVEKLLDVAVNEIMLELRLSGVAIFLIKDNYLYAVAIDDAPPGRQSLLKLLGLTRFSLKISLNEPTDNICVKCVKESKAYFSNDAYDFTKDVLNKQLTNYIARMSNFNSGIVLPMNMNEKVIGAVMYMKSEKENFENERGILEAFTEYLAVAISNAKRFEQLLFKINEK